ncbi:MAG: hypothetical protein ACYC35_10215 [Pirellulales bacterium]
MNRNTVISNAIAGMALLVANAARADVPPPPVNQSIGLMDVAMGTMTEAVCRGCHSSGVSNRHHLLYGKPIPPGSKVPFPDADGNRVPDTTYGCFNCHGPSFTVATNCLACHTATAHHATATAKSGQCKACHGSVVDDMTDGHYIPTYAPSLSTPTPTKGDGLPLNRRGKGAGACDYCHDSDALATPLIRNMADLHHDPNFDCLWCHDLHMTRPPMRICERCHGPDSLHSIQADSPAPGSIGTIVVGGELAGYGHVGRNASPGDSDCWGCHGYAGAASAPGTGPVIPTVYGADQATITAGTDTVAILMGAAFTNTTGGTLYEADVVLTAASGTSVTLIPDIIVDEGMLVVTIPRAISPGNYGLRATTGGLTSNVAAISVVPPVKITQATWSLDKRVTITGSGFGGYAAGSGTAVMGEVSNGVRTKSVTGEVVSWDPGKIVVKFPLIPSAVTVKSVFGNAKSAVGKR